MEKRNQEPQQLPLPEGRPPLSFVMYLLTSAPPVARNMSMLSPAGGFLRLQKKRSMRVSKETSDAIKPHRSLNEKTAGLLPLYAVVTVSVAKAPTFLHRISSKNTFA